MWVECTSAIKKNNVWEGEIGVNDFMFDYLLFTFFLPLFYLIETKVHLRVCIFIYIFILYGRKQKEKREQKQNCKGIK